MASSRVGSRIRARTGFFLPRTEGSEISSRRSIIGTRKLRVLPVPVEAVARMSSPSSAGGIAPACTGVGVTKPAVARRCFSSGEMAKSVKVSAEASSCVMWREGASGSGFRMDSSVSLEVSGAGCRGACLVCCLLLERALLLCCLGRSEREEELFKSFLLEEHRWGRIVAWTRTAVQTPGCGRGILSSALRVVQSFRRELGMEQALLLHGEVYPVWIASKPEQPTCGAAMVPRCGSPGG